MKIEYAIPSHGRPDRIKGWALKALADAGVPPEDISIFVPPDQADAYVQALAPKIDQGLLDPEEAGFGALLQGGHGLAAQRAAIDRWYRPGARVVQLDDDIRQIVRRVNSRKLEPVTDLPAVAAEAFTMCDMIGARLWGVYPTLNAGWMGAGVRTGLTFICGGLFGHVVDHGCAVTLDQKEDFERTLRYWEADGTVLRLEYIGMRTTMYNPGGMQAPGQPDRRRLNREAVQFLRTKWPTQVAVSRRVGKVGLEIRLKDQNNHLQ